MSEIISVRVSRGLKNRLSMIAAENRKTLTQILVPILEDFAKTTISVKTEEWEISTWVSFGISASQLNWAISTSRDLAEFFSNLSRFNKKIDTEIISSVPHMFMVSFTPKAWFEPVIVTVDSTDKSLRSAIKETLTKLFKEIEDAANRGMK